MLQRQNIPVRLVPGPREISPNCGVAVAFVWDDEARVAQTLEDSKIRFEAIHRYEVDDGS
jgi:translation elongation factor EF-Ts